MARASRIAAVRVFLCMKQIIFHRDYNRPVHNLFLLVPVSEPQQGHVKRSLLLRLPPLSRLTILFYVCKSGYALILVFSQKQMLYCLRSRKFLMLRYRLKHRIMRHDVVEHQLCRVYVARRS
jgi:hypothetical protein